MADVHFLDIVVLFVYFLGVTLAGLYFGRKNKSTSEYFLGNRNFPAWAIGLSLVGTSISSISFLAYPADAYKTAWLRMLPNFVLPVAIIIAGLYILPFFRKNQITSAFEYLEGRFGPSTRIYGAVAFVIAQLARISLILFLVSQLVHVFTGWDVWVCIVIGGLFVGFYTVVGGIEAVVWTDVVQTIILIFGGLLCLIIVIRDLPGGLGTVIGDAVEAGKFQFSEYVEETNSFKRPSWDLTFYRKTALMMLFIGLVNWLYEYTCNQNVVQRYAASRSMREARRAMIINCCTSIPIWAYFMFLGTAFWVYFQHFPTEESQAMLTGEGGAKAEQILPYFVLNQLPIGLAGLVVAAVLAAAMSSLDSSINAISTVSVVDIYRRHLVKDRNDTHYLLVARMIALVSMFIMIGGAIVLTSEVGKTAQDTQTVLVAITAGGLLGLYFLGFATTIGDGRAVAIAIACTIVFSLYRSLEGLGVVPPMPIDTYYTGIVGHVLMFVVGFVLASLIPGPKRNLTNLTWWTMDDEKVE